MMRHEAPGRIADVVIGLSLLLIAAGICVLGYQGVLFFRDASGWTNISVSDFLDTLDIQEPFILMAHVRTLTDLVWDCPLAVALVMCGALLPFVYGAITDTWHNFALARAARRENRGRRKELDTLE